MNASYLPHPYLPCNPKRNEQWNAVSYSRLDWDKHTEIIAGANEILPNKLKCKIYGSENRLYAYMKLDKVFPNWKNDYKGKFPKVIGAGAIVASKAKFAVDMSAIKKDGNGSQYTFLEAWDAGSVLVLNSKWTQDNKGEMRDGFNCIAVNDSKELAEVLSSSPDQSLLENGKKSLIHHQPQSVASIIKGILG